MRRITLDGKKMTSIASFYRYIDEIFDAGFGAYTINLDTFKDFFNNPYGSFNENEKLEIEFNNVKDAKKNLGVAFLTNVVKILQECDRVILILDLYI